MNPDLDVFSSVVVQTAIKSEQIVEFFPISPLQDGQPIQFDIPETFTQMTAPNFLLKIKAKIVDGKGESITADAKVAPTNLTLHSLFKDVVLKVNGVTVNQASNTYPYRAYIETNYTYSQAAKDGAVGIPQMYYQEKAGMFEAVDANLNPSFDKRKDKFSKSAMVEMAGRLHCDLLMQNKLIIPGIRFSVIFFPTIHLFRLLADSEDVGYKLLISTATLQIKRVNLSSSVLLSIERAMQQKPAKYPISRAVVRTTQIISGQSQLSNFVVHSGQMPRLVLMTLINSTAFDGHYKYNPFDFTLKNCKSAQLEANGILYPPLPYTPDSSWIEPYLNSLQVVNKLYSDSSSGLTLDDFLKEGHQILAFDMNPTEDTSTPILTNPRVNAVLTLNALWKTTEFTNNYTVLLYLLWDNVITIDGRRNVILDYIP